MKLFSPKKSILKIAAFLMSVGILLTGCDGVSIGTDDNGASTATSGTQIDSSKELDIHFIDVGQADCSLITLPDGENMMIDTGNRDDFDTIDKYLTDLSIKSLDYMVLTHPHEDHIGSAAKIITKYKPKKVYMPDATANTRVFENTMKAISETGVKLIKAKPGDYIFKGDASMEILSPIGSGYESLNDYSIITRLVYGDRAFLFTGDAEKTAEKEVLDSGAELKCDVLKVGHHGSSTSSTNEFLDAVSPDYAVIQCGVNNDYGHPHKETLEKLNSRHINILRNDKDGTIVCRTDGKNISFDGFDISSQSTNNSQFIGNKNSKVFHTPDCNNNMSDKNKVYFDSYDEAVDAGYSPCSKCNPSK